MSSTILQRQENEISALIPELNSLGASASNCKTNNKSDRPLLPKLSHWYRIGVVLYSSSSSRGDQQQRPPPLVQMQESYRKLVSCLPAPYMESCFATLQKALEVLLAKTTITTSNKTNTSTTTTAPTDFASLSDAIQSLVGLLSHSKRACQLAYSHDLLASLASIYDHCLRLESSSSPTEEYALLETSKHVSLQCLSHLLLDGLIFRFSDSHNNNADQPKQQPQPLEHQFMQALQTIEEQSTECIGDLLAWQDVWEQPQQQERRVEVALRGCSNAGTDSTQLDYVLQMLETARRDYNTRKQKRLPVGHGGTASSSKPVPTTTKALTQVSGADELDRRIDQVQTLLPDLGAGFIETALSHYQGNVETTVSMLFGDSSLLPPALRVIDRHLPRRKKANSGKQEEEELAAEAKQVVKDRMALERKQEEERYRALLYVAQQEEQEQRHQNAQQQGGQEESAIATTYHGEYDDDYDDQYDDMADGGLGGADSGWYDTGGNNDTTSDYDKVRLYNQVARQEEAEGAFWEENRNTNRLGSNNGKNGLNGGADDDEGEEGAAGNKFRRPDKIKGGRVIGPDGKVVKNNRFGKKQQQQQQQQQKAAAVGASQPQQQQQGERVNGAASGTGGPTQPPKPRTKPKSNNRVQRQRDKKQQKQGTFGESAS